MNRLYLSAMGAAICLIGVPLVIVIRVESIGSRLERQLEELRARDTRPTSTPATGPTSGTIELAEVLRLQRQQVAAIQRLPQAPTAMPGFGEAAAFLSSAPLRLASEDSRPKSMAQLARFEEELRAVLKPLPVGAQDALVREIGLLRWSIAVVQGDLEWGALKAEELDGAHAAAESLATAAPEGAPPAFVALLKATQGWIEFRQREVTRAARDEAITKATTFLAKGIGDPGPLAEALAPFDDDAAVHAALAKLQEQMLIHRAEQGRQQAERQLKRMAGLADPHLRNAALLQVYQQATAQKLELALGEMPTPVPPDFYDALIGESKRMLDDSAVGLRREEAAKSRRYQQWTLKQIFVFDKWQKTKATETIESVFASLKGATNDGAWDLLDEIPECRHLLSEKTGIKIDGSALSASTKRAIYEKVYKKIGWNYIDELAYCSHKHATIHYLLPIDPARLDPPVAMIYNDRMTQAREMLSGDDQWNVALECSQVTRVTPEDIK